MDAVILTPGEGREMMLGSVRVTVQEDGAHTRGTFGLAEFAFPPHAPAPPPHVHHAHEEGFYILEGELEFLVGGESIHVGQGTFILVPIGVAHSFGKQRGLSGTIDIHIRHILEPMEQMTRLNRDLTLHLHGLVRVAQPFVVAAFRQENERMLLALKRYVEQGT